LSNVPGNKAGSASGIYKRASSLGAAFGVAISAAIFYGLGQMESIPPMADIFMGRTDKIDVRYAAGIGLLFIVFMVVVAIDNSPEEQLRNKHLNTAKYNFHSN
jgi:DHA2 family multidrug resistance protein-like MFS transporter